MIENLLESITVSFGIPEIPSIVPRVLSPTRPPSSVTLKLIKLLSDICVSSTITSVLVTSHSKISIGISMIGCGSKLLSSRVIVTLSSSVLAEPSLFTNVTLIVPSIL